MGHACRYMLKYMCVRLIFFGLTHPGTQLHMEHVWECMLKKRVLQFFLDFFDKAVSTVDFSYRGWTKL